MKIWIYRPDVARINPHLLFSPKGKPFIESKEDERELKNKIEELKDYERHKKLQTKKEL